MNGETLKAIAKGADVILMQDAVSSQASESVKQLIKGNWPLIQRAWMQSENDAITMSFSSKVRIQSGFVTINTKFSSGLNFSDEDERTVALNQEEMPL